MGYLMIQAFREFMGGILKFHPGWQVWVGFMVMLNMVVPLFFLSHPEAQLTLLAMMAGGMTGLLLVKIQGFTKLLGLMHIFWIPLVIFLLGRVHAFDSASLFGIWLWAVIAINCISLIIDTADVITWYRSR